MKETIVENHASESFQEEEEAHRLSFCDLLMAENNSASAHHSPRTSGRTDHLFEFFASQPEPASRSKYNDIIFCGKIIHEKEEEEDEDQLNEYQKRDYFATVKSQSFRKPSFSDHQVAENRRVSASTRLSGDLDYHVQRVNITSLTSMSAKSRRRMFMFGPVKFKPEMELSAIKQRQAKRAPAEKSAASGGGKSQWGLVKSSLRGRSHLTSMLARSLGCIPVAGGGGGAGGWVGVTN